MAWSVPQAPLFSPSDARTVYRSGLLHDLGLVAAPAGIWERPGPLRAEEWELVRLHPYHTGRILARSPVLAPLGLIACRHHERMDGSGYPAGMGGSELDTAACLLAAPGACPGVIGYGDESCPDCSCPSGRGWPLLVYGYAG